MSRIDQYTKDKNATVWASDDVKWAEHKLNPADSTDDMMAAAQLNWGVTKQPLFMKDQDKPVREAFALCRDDTGDVLDIVGPAYTPVQNEQAFNFFKGFVEAGKAKMVAAGNLNNGQMVWALADLGKSVVLPGKDKVNSQLLMASPHRQGKSLIMKFTYTRVFCHNQILRLANSVNNKLVGESLRRAHRGEFDEIAQDKAKEALGLARDDFAEFSEMAVMLSNKKIEKLQAAQIIAEAFGDDDFTNESNLDTILKDSGKATRAALAALDMSPGSRVESALGTAWGVLNAITYTTDHILRNDENSRQFHAWFGKNAKVKLTAMKILEDA
jgi:phage/plasmid-like protein (TIGR03299 family)